MLLSGIILYSCLYHNVDESLCCHTKLCMTTTSWVWANTQSGTPPNKQANTCTHTEIFSSSLSHPWVRGSSHCVVRVLWLTKYTLPLSWRFSVETNGAEGACSVGSEVLGKLHTRRDQRDHLTERRRRKKSRRYERKAASLCGISLWGDPNTSPG